MTHGFYKHSLYGRVALLRIVEPQASIKRLAATLHYPVGKVHHKLLLC